MTRVLLNGEPRELPVPALGALLGLLGLEPGRRGIAVAVNGAVVPRSRWSQAELADGDEVEVLTAVQGG